MTAEASAQGGGSGAQGAGGAGPAGQRRGVEVLDAERGGAGLRIGALLSGEGAWLRGGGGRRLGSGEAAVGNAALILSGAAPGLGLRFLAVLNPAFPDFFVEDAYVADAGPGPWHAAVGNQKEPFGQQVLVGAGQVALLERPLASALAPGRAMGASLGYVRAPWTATVGLYGAHANRDPGGAGLGVGARLTHAADLGNGRLLHLGAAAGLRRHPADPFAVAVLPETRRASAPLLSTGALRAGEVARLGAEAALRIGPALLQAEWHALSLSGARGEAGPPGGRGGATAQGGYVQASWLLTGEARPYLAGPDVNARGVFDRPSPARPVSFGPGGPGGGGAGAVELVARWSAVDLTDGAPPLRAGRGRAVAVGANWFLDDRVRLAGQVVRTDARGGRGGPSGATVYQLRAEVWF